MAPVPEPFQHRIADPFQPFPEPGKARRNPPPAAAPESSEPFRSPPVTPGFEAVISDPGPSEEDLPYFKDPIPQGDPRAYFRNGPPPEPEIPLAPEPVPSPAPPPAAVPVAVAPPIANPPPPPPAVVMHPAVLISPPERPRPVAPAAPPAAVAPVFSPQPAAPAPAFNPPIEPFAEVAPRRPPPSQENLDPTGAFTRKVPPARQVPERSLPERSRPEEIRPTEEAPFAGFRPRERMAPAAEPLRPHHASAESSRCHLGRLRGAVLVLSSLLCLVIGFVTGHVMALREQAVAPPIFSMTEEKPRPELQVVDPDTRPTLNGLDEDPKLAGPDEIPSAPPSLPEPVPGGPDEIAPPEEEPKPESYGTLEAFLSAPSWAARAVHVYDPEAAGPSLRERGDGVIEVLSIRPDMMDEDFHHYVLSTKSIPEGFPVTLIRHEGGWRVDWETFDEFAHDRLRAFAAKGEGKARFHVFLKPSESANKDYVRCEVSAPKPMENRSFPAFAREDGQAGAKIRAMLTSEIVKTSPDYQRMLGDQGLPVVVVLSRSANTKGQPFLVIEDLIRFGWAPEP